MKIRVRGYLLVNIVLLVVIIAMGIVLLNDDALATLNESVGGPVYKVPEATGKISLMVNVDWGEDYLPEMLDTFRNQKVRATFFLTGKWATKNPELCKRIAQEGHEIASHGETTSVMMSKLNRSDTRANLLKAQEEIAQASGVTPKLFAPHSGDYSQTTQDVANELGLPLIMWSIDTVDWRRDGQDKILARVFKQPHDGALVLMHPTEDTVKVLPQIIQGFRDRGYEPDTVSSLLALRGD